MSGVRLHLTRDSVAPGDDVFAPHEKTITVPGPISTPAELQQAVAALAPDYLPSVMGRTSWAAWCGVPLAVLSTRGKLVRPFFLLDDSARRFDRTPDGFRVEFLYFGSHDPDVVYDILSRIPRI